jgi:hypothetical protein
MSQPKNGVEVFFEVNCLEVKYGNGEQVIIPYDKIQYVHWSCEKDKRPVLYRVEVFSGKSHCFYTTTEDFASRLNRKLNR